MKVVLAVIDDLFQFIRESLFGSSVLPSKTTVERYDHAHHSSDDVEPQTHFLLKEYSGALEASNQFVHGEQYFVGIQNVYLHADPVIAFDSAGMHIPYGSKVQLLKFGGRWAHIRFDGAEGWILKDVLKMSVAEVFPQFLVGSFYDAHNEETKKLRLCIDDAFGCATAEVILTGAEYVVYMLQKHKRYIAWSLERPRIPGTWQRKLRGNEGIHIGIHPKTQSVMEYSIDDIGYVAFVEAVFPDDSIKITGVGLSAEGYYSEEVMSKEQWRELRPVFIEVT